MSASTDDTLPMAPFSQRYTVRRRYVVIRYHIPFRIPVPSSSDDGSVEIPASQRIRRDSPIQPPDSPGDIMALGHSSPSPPILKPQRRPTEDAMLSKVAGPRYVA
ncbi:hypothetical protein FGIG_08745 [Fasciola gigantica]|uniref:Uncharacterized protein n=1 Tax=Fasciola gigantica TaxID=46835 RepID=A0A504WT01_FASGI|nr:hypothetical protein FGIG_08745 [Fasciola gigantica]